MSDVLKNRRILVVGFLLFSSLLYPNELDVLSKNKLPNWVKNTPQGKYYNYYKGVGTSN